MGLFTKKPIHLLMQEAGDSEKGMKRTLTAGSLVALGIGAIIGAGLFVRTAAAAAQNAGPSVTIGFIVAAIGCALAGLCYAELSSSIPISGSAYTYTYATMGELLAWVIGWDLVLEYAVGAATVGIAWSEYLNNLLVHVMHLKPIAYEWCHSPFEHLHKIKGETVDSIVNFFQNKDHDLLLKSVSIDAKTGIKSLVIPHDLFVKIPTDLSTLVESHNGIVNIPAFGIVALLSLLLIKGTQESAFVNGLIVITKVSIVILIIVLGWGFIQSTNHDIYIPEPTIYKDSQGISHNFGGIMGILGAAGVVFFAFIGFDAVSTAAQETKNPKTAMPIGILGSLAVCTVLYILFAHVLTGIAPVEFFRTDGKEASVVAAINKFMPGYAWLGKLVTVAILAGFSSVILVMLLGQSRVFYSMSKDGLLPAVFSELHPKFKTPYKANLIILVIVGAFAAFVPGDIVGDMTSIGTLFAFILVCAAVIILRKTDPDLPRQFKTPWVPVVPILGIIVCAAMIFGLGWTNWLRLFGWLAIGFVIYFGYSKNKSHLKD
jgi:APA family basic amino acid/polyamine antiporter